MPNFEPPFEMPDEDPSREGVDGETVEEPEPISERSEVDIDRIIADCNRRLEDLGQIGWKDDTPLTELSVYQRSVQAELLAAAAEHVANGMDEGLARQFALLNYLIEHPDTFIEPIF